MQVAVYSLSGKEEHKGGDSVGEGARGERGEKKINQKGNIVRGSLTCRGC